MVELVLDVVCDEVELVLLLDVPVEVVVGPVDEYEVVEVLDCVDDQQSENQHVAQYLSQHLSCLSRPGGQTGAAFAAKYDESVIERSSTKRTVESRRARVLLESRRII